MTVRAPIRLAHHSGLSPSPDPLAREGFERLLGSVASQLATQARTEAPESCPVERALGRAVACRGRSCAYHRVPGVTGTCAVERWTGSSGPSRQLAGWFVARRREAAISTYEGLRDQPEEENQ